MVQAPARGARSLLKASVSSAAPKTIVAYADGSCIGNPGPGGWGVVILRPDGAPQEWHGGEPDTTNNRMELTAAIKALQEIERGSQVELRSDSQYVVKGINENQKRKVNVDLWKQLDAERAARVVTFQWVRGHADDPYNVRADELAHSEAEKIARGDVSPLKSSRGAGSAARAEEDASRELKRLLSDDWAIRKCAGCGRMFVTKQALYCALVECQLKAHRAAESG